MTEEVRDTASEGSQADVPLVVDLDGTLCRTDTLHEAVLGLVSRDPTKLLALPGWLREGRAGFKARVADHVVLDAEHLPFNPEVIALVESARAEGRLLQAVPLEAIDLGYLVRDRLLDPLNEEMDSLKQSLRARGQQTPVELVALEGAPGYGLISGLRRVTALRQLYEETGEARFATALARLIRPFASRSTPATSNVAVTSERIRSPSPSKRRANCAVERRKETSRSSGSIKSARRSLVETSRPAITVVPDKTPSNGAVMTVS